MTDQEAVKWLREIQRLGFAARETKDSLLIGQIVGLANRIIRERFGDVVEDCEHDWQPVPGQPVLMCSKCMAPKVIRQ
jgi:hypothetical protein